MRIRTLKRIIRAAETLENDIPDGAFRCYLLAFATLCLRCTSKLTVPRLIHVAVRQAIEARSFGRNTGGRESCSRAARGLSSARCLAVVILIHIGVCTTCAARLLCRDGRGTDVFASRASRLLFAAVLPVIYLVLVAA